MCGRYSLALRPSQVRRLLEDDDVPISDAPDDEGDDAPQQTYNFAPGYYGVVCRADTSDWGDGPCHISPRPEEDAKKTRYVPAEGAKVMREGVKYRLQSMQWGLIPFWTKRKPGYADILKTINCRSDSLADSGGLWQTMKSRKRCMVVAQGFYEWLQRPGCRTKTPHFVKRADGKLMCIAGLWDFVRYDSDSNAEESNHDGQRGKRHYTYTIITTESNAQLSFLHDRMPVIIEQESGAMRTWLDPGRHVWSQALQVLLKPYEGKLEVYPVSSEVSKVGNESANFTIPVASRENKSNIANFFAKAKDKGREKETGEGRIEQQTGQKQEAQLKGQRQVKESPEKGSDEDAKVGVYQGGTSVDLDDPGEDTFEGTGARQDVQGEKRRRCLPSPTADASPIKMRSLASHKRLKEAQRQKAKRSATTNQSRDQVKGRRRRDKAAGGAQMITQFFASSAGS